MGERLFTFMNNYLQHFWSYRRDVSGKARQYLSGLMQAGPRKKNMDRMAEIVPDCDSRNLQQFLTHSKWSAREVMDHVARDVSEALGDEREACLVIDESGFAKQGRSSVGVARQWLGRLGKVDNGQVGVYGVLARESQAAPVDARLYLPEEWTKDPARCRKAGVPEDERIFRTKTELAVQIVENARHNGLKYGWVGADAGYGKGFGFCRSLEALGETFMVDLHSNARVYLEDPCPYIPEKTSKRGRGFTRRRTDRKPLTVRETVESAPRKKWKTVQVRSTTRGPLALKACRLKVHVWPEGADEVKTWHLLATKTIGPEPELKISITNAPGSTSLRRLAFMQRQRYWVERVFEDAKGACGMADYQARKFSAWYHHMALVLMAMLFMLIERLDRREAYPLLSCRDIEWLLARFLPRREVTREQVIDLLERRHKRRRSAITSHSRKNAKTRPAGAKSG